MRVVGIHRPATVSGVSASGVRLAALPEPFTPWRPLVIGETPDGDPAGLLERSPLRDAPGVAACAWGPGADVPTRLSLIRASLREMRAEVVVPNDLPEGFAAAALEPEMAIAAWYHADHHDGDELLLRCGELADAWRAVSERGAGRVRRRAAEWSLAIRGGGGVCPSCVEVPARPPAPRSADGRLSLLYAGRLEKQTKRVLDLAALAVSMRGADVPLRLVIAGAGPAEEELRSAARDLGVLDSLEFRGVVPLAQMRGLVAECDAAVLVSESEGMPTIVMEAMAGGRPVAITTGCGMAASIVRHGIDGWLATTGDMVSLGSAIAVSWRHSAMQSMGEAAHAKALAQFSPVAMGPAYDALIIEAAAARASRPSAARRWDAVLAAIEALGELSASELDRLAEEFERRAGIERGVLPRRLPRRPGPAARLLSAAIGELLERKVRRIALYGAGRHTAKVASVVAACPQIVCVIDDRAGLPGVPATVLGRPVLTPREAIVVEIDAVIINSDEHEREMLPRARSWAEGRPVVGLYAPPVSPSGSSAASLYAA